MRKQTPKELGEFLVESKLITAENLGQALEIQKQKGGLLTQILVSLGHTNEQAIAQALTAHFGYPYLPLAGYEIDGEICKLIPENVCRQYGLIAVDRVGSLLTLAMSNPLNKQAIEDVEMITHLKAQVFVTTATDVSEAIKRSYKT